MEYIWICPVHGVVDKDKEISNFKGIPVCIIKKKGKKCRRKVRIVLDTRKGLKIEIQKILRRIKEKTKRLK